ncbi:MAG TPA: hypothetical protein VL793_13405 [Patescibacteria group bacterium]|jgi:hypothetical protein|nr:hypothetical protein [Patescibacteria group bacterium]
MAQKEVRFRKLVDVSGKPQIVSLWSDPKRDHNFMKAIKEHRVLTVIQEPRTHKKQFGKPGFHQDPRASYLIFPKPLPVDSESRVIGISFDLTAEPRVKDPVRPRDLGPPAAKKKTNRGLKNFTVILRRTGVVETSLEVQARNASEAERKALEQVRSEPFDGSKAVIKNQVMAVNHPFG